MLPTTEICLRLGAAVVAGGLVGINREMHAKPVGVRTLSLVALGAALVTLAGSGFSGDGTDANASRAIQGTITGIGFLGAGVIVKAEGRGRVHGLTTAAAIWVTAALGIACGLGAYRPLALGTVFLLATLLVGGVIDRAIDARWRRRTGVPRQEDGAAE
ncbi:MgtC/SapB family protein [Methylobacterium nonmethylotrophicum]|uniref:Protein MgtC n=1 Tax=Methylobacterium nonmethylotrophicum TaxID=1141884 RepID=A0A4Z0NLZ1_9HYPH|nr:MgtC/SapB family protein [Methylobacterium nonmethylotrophicum]TGD96971.1 MgtC/SapB family protein [Methylobacterium nonmethylotrophicum]